MVCGFDAGLNAILFGVISLNGILCAFFIVVVVEYFIGNAECLDIVYTSRKHNTTAFAPFAQVSPTYATHAPHIDRCNGVRCTTTSPLHAAQNGTNYAHHNIMGMRLLIKLH